MDTGLVSVLADLHARFFDRLLARRNRITITNEQVLSRRADEGSSGIVIGRW